MFILPCGFGGFRLRSADSKALGHHGREGVVEQGCLAHGGQGAERGKERPPSVSFQDAPLSFN